MQILFFVFSVLAEGLIEFVWYGLWRLFGWWALLVPVNVVLMATFPSWAFFYASVVLWVALVVLKQFKWLKTPEVLKN